MNWIRAIRLPNLIIIGFTQMVVKYALIHPYFRDQQLLFPDHHFLFLVISTICLSLFAYLINDYFDHELDRISHRKIKAHYKKRTYWRASLLVGIVGFTLAAFLAFAADLLHLLWVYPLTCMVLFIYSKYLKSTGLPGNIVVALFTSFVIFIVMISETEINFSFHRDLYILLLSFMIFSFLANLYREIIKDLEDEHEDQLSGLNTLPIRIGQEKANFVAFFIGAFLLVVVIMFGCFVASNVFQRVHIFGCLAIPLIFILFLNFKAKSTDNYHQISTYLKLVMIFGLLYLTHGL